LLRHFMILKSPEVGLCEDACSLFWDDLSKRETGNYRRFFFTLHTSPTVYLRQLMDDTYRFSMMDKHLLLVVASEPPSMTSQLECEAAEKVRSRHTSRFSDIHESTGELTRTS